MAGLKERLLKRYQKGEDDWNPAVAQILEEGSVGHDPEVKKRMHMNKGSGNPYSHTLQGVT